MKAANKQLEEWDRELTQLHERNGDLGLELQNLKEELAVERRNCEQVKGLRPAAIKLSELFEELNQLKKQRKNSQAVMAEIEAVLESIKPCLT